ncbi:tyrosine-protein phosphatase non-receptor type 7-like [Haliotis rubra]|uniref:tyrosine-protein phosphatase non-receptor type 7-like n=1 Tax=Haliotis rubra TaxID=36100 RepID=UPI001EE606C5|nr:tyrosine-protein phosphatase non-receptor type 7-like [Haliotis rubra]
MVRDADGIYVNVELTKVKVAELREYIAKREDKFVSEYGRVPRGLLHAHTAATTPEHRPKNRFKAMYPYDHSRVVLQKTPRDKHSDYINANYINTYKEKKAFIATQGPMPKTVGDFWRMIWQEETDIIVMLTRLKEGIKVKCEKYWPEEKSPLKLGDLTITNDGVTERPDYCITQITIQHKKLNERRQVMHLHYVTWPDHGVPSSPPLVRFWKVFRSMAADSKAPVVVHCSAGVGRTGTFIALEALMERARREGVVDVHEFVLKMRADRVSMVQTKERYLFLHQVVLEALYSDMTHMTPTMFDSRFCTDSLASASEEAILKRMGETR